MRLRVLVAVFLLALPAGSVVAADSSVVLHLLNRTVGIQQANLPAPDVPANTYTVRGEKKSKKVNAPAAISMTTLFASQGAKLSEYKFVQVRRPDLSYLYLPNDTDAIVWPDGDGTTHFLRPLNGKKDKNATDVFKLDPGKPLVMTARTGNLLLVVLKTSTTQAEKGQEITFSATVTGQKKNEKLTYTWRFGDGQTGDGQNVKHAYDSTGRYNVFVSVTGSDDSAGSSDEVRITVGNPPAAGTTGGGGSSGGPTGGTTPTTPPPVVNNTPQTPPAPITSIPKTESTPGTTKVTGILLASSNPVSADSLLSPGSRPLASTSSTPDLEVPLVAAAVVLLLGLGAFFEGGGRIRIPKLWPR